MEDLLLIIILILHLAFAAYTQWMIIKTPMLSASQKRINSALNWIIPFVWSFTIRNIIKPAKTETMTKSRRGSKKGGNSDAWETLTGYGSGGGFGD